MSDQQYHVYGCACADCQQQRFTSPAALPVSEREGLIAKVQRDIARLGPSCDNENYGVTMLTLAEARVLLTALHSSSAVVVGADQQKKEQEDDHARVDVGTQLGRPSASTGSTASDNEASPSGCICPLDGSTCWSCGGLTRHCEDEAFAISEIHDQAFIQAGIDIGFCYNTDEAMSRVLDAARKHGAELSALAAPQADDAVDPHLSARGTDAGLRAQEPPSSLALPDPGSPEREK
jgi:hypothetical protein